MAATETPAVVLPPHIARVAASLYCTFCGGDMIGGTCTCDHDFCAECVGCATCDVHDRGCSHHPRNQQAASPL